MLRVNQSIGFGVGGGAGGNGSILTAIQNRGLTSGLKLLVDAGALGSYPGSGTKWSDISGNGYDFDFEASANDPSFNGTAGGDSANEFMLYDGNDWHDYDTTVETWMSNLHKDGAIFSYIAGAVIGTGTTLTVFDTVSAASQSGVRVQISTSGAINHQLLVVDDAGATEIQLNSSVTPGGAVWHFIGGSLTESSSTSGILKTNGTDDTGLTVTYPSPGTAAATPMRLGLPIAGGAQAANSRIAFLTIWEGVALTQTNLDNLYDDIKAARAYGF